MQRLSDVELPPFQAAADADVAAIMVAHVTVPALDRFGVWPTAAPPASLHRPLPTACMRCRVSLWSCLETADGISQCDQSATLRTTQAARELPNRAGVVECVMRRFALRDGVAQLGVR
jgi:hypothetical protein